MMLNDSVVRTAKAGIIWDTYLRGFGLRTGKQTKTFIVRVAHGRSKRIGRYPLISLSEARAIAKKILAEKTLGKTHPTALAYEDAREQFLSDRAVRPSTLKLYRRHLTLHMPFARRSITDITPLDILGKLKSLSPSEKEHAFRVARTFFTWCHRHHLIDRSPMERMEPPPLGAARERVLTDDELKAVYEWACKAQNSLQRLVFLLISTGQRVGELRHLKWAYISDSITLPKEITKNGRTHTFPISKTVQDALQTFPRYSDYVFPAARTHVRGKPVDVMTVPSKAREQMKKEAGVADFTLHDLRRTFATNMQQLGVRLEVTEALLNHISGSRAGIVGIYQRHNFFKEMEHAIALWDAKLTLLYSSRLA